VKTYWEAIFDNVIADERYKRNIEYGKPRRGHDEGTVKAHIEELERNLTDLWRTMGLSTATYWKLRVLIHVHDAFKAEAKRDSPILDPQSHASLATNFLAEFTDDDDMLAIVQFHDLGYAVFKALKEKGVLNEAKLMAGLNAIHDLDLYLTFAIIDACTASKGREGITWLVGEVKKRFPAVTVGVENILEGEVNVGEAW
jgi:hypothetical protein